ncbi:HlyD family efflux transporter periplasmic adaptor subunit [Pontimicrobium sp. IMCC45349]|uniref:HlyD family efflux transporter periplasmic adaptor subunit n=1 Tax=Pontimicrobium sp. IMCC45349 TaxID=3391574 RepID=UPI0039A2F41F
MKSFSFKSKKSTLRVLKEPVIKKKHMSFDRALYLIIIAVGLFFLLKYIIDKTTVINANGQVLMSKVDVNFTHDIRLLKFNVFEGDTIESNQRLFTYLEDQFDNDGTVYFSNQERTQNKAKKELELRFKVRSKQIQIRAQKNKIKLLTDNKEKTINLVLLDVYTIDKLNDITSHINAETVKLDLLKSEIALLYEQLRYLKDDKNPLNVSYGFGEGKEVNSSYLAPIKGVIGQISVNENETCYRTESVLTIHNPEQVFIKAYFDLDEIKNINVMDEITIQFPDKTKSKGIINKYYVSTYALPEEFQKTYEPTERSIVVEVIPLNNLEKQKWAKYHKLNVLIKKSKYSF